MVIPRYRLNLMAKQALHKTRVIFDDLIEELDKGHCLWCNNGDSQVVKLRQSLWYCVNCDTAYLNGHRHNRVLLTIED